MVSQHQIRGGNFKLIGHEQQSHYFPRILVQGVKLVHTVVYKMWVSNKTTGLVSNHDWVDNKNKIINGKVHLKNINLVLGGIQEPKMAS